MQAQHETFLYTTLSLHVYNNECWKNKQSLGNYDSQEQNMHIINAAASHSDQNNI